MHFVAFPLLLDHFSFPLYHTCQSRPKLSMPADRTLALNIRRPFYEVALDAVRFWRSPEAAPPVSQWEIKPPSSANPPRPPYIELPIDTSPELVEELRRIVNERLRSTNDPGSRSFRTSTEVTSSSTSLSANALSAPHR